MIEYLDNIILDVDTYKPSQWLQYPPGTQVVHSYIESRGGRFDKTVFFGLQPYLEKLAKPITREMVDQAEAFIDAHVGPGVFNREGWDYIVNQLGGKLPLRIKAVPEGTVVPTKNVLVTVENTDPNCYWLTSYVETAMLRAAWYGTTVASLSYKIRQTIKRYLEETGDVAGLPFKLHDFGARGVSSFESAGIGGAAHLATGALGSDTITGVLYADRYYGAVDGDLIKNMIAFSIPASEHSTMTSWGGRSGELAAMKNLLDKYLKPGKIVACVSDSYDIFNAITNYWGKELKDQIVNSGGTLVVRPDSGEPIEITLKCVELLGEAFGYTYNSKGYRVLPPYIRMIQGDGIDDVMVEKILENFKRHGWSADNIAFGCGGGLLQKLDRDTLKFAMKCSAIKVAGEWRDVYKDPITDSGKQSKKGRLSLYKDTLGNLYTGEYGNPDDHVVEDVLVTVFLNGEVIKSYTFDQVRVNANK